jgi:hypothetical protein
MADLTGFNAREVEPTDDFSPLPAGRYPVVITESELKPNKAGTGSYLQFAFVVIDGDYKGRYLWARLNLIHPNNVAVDLARAELSAICRAVGVMEPSDSSDLHDLPLMVTVKCRKRPDDGEITNEIKGYSACDRDEGPPPASATKNGSPKTPKTPKPSANGKAGSPWRH